MLAFALLLVASLVVVILSPLWQKAEAPLAEAWVIEDSQKLHGMKKAVLRSYLDAEKQFADGFLTERQWRARKEFLTHRYVDIAMRLTE